MNSGTVYVKNRDIILLDRAQSLLAEVCALEEKREKLRELRFKATSSISGMPHGGKARGLDEIVAEIDEMDEKYAMRLRMYLREQRQADAILEGIACLDMRAFVRMVYVEKRARAYVISTLKMREWGYRQARKNIENARDMAHARWQNSFVLREKKTGNDDHTKFSPEK